MRRVIPSFVWLLLISSAGCAQPPATQPQCSWSGVERIVAVGDVHGDYDQFVRVLKAAQVIDAKGDWTAGKTHLVQTGDVLDRGPDSRKAMDLLIKLARQAAQAGGMVHPLLGNHEAMMLAGDWRYVHPGEVKAFGGEEPYRRALSSDGLYGRWLRRHNAVIRINDVLFVHAGLTAKYKDMSLPKINQTVRADLDTPDRHGPAEDSAGPLWDRTLAEDDERLVRPELDEVLSRFGARHMVVGHTFSTEGVQARAGGRLIRIDVGMSGFYGGPAACLLIDKGVFYEVRDGRAKRKLDVEIAPLEGHASSRPGTPADPTKRVPPTPPNTWVEFKPAFSGAPRGGRYVAVGWNKMVYDSVGHRELIVDRWKDDLRDLTIYANAAIAVDPAAAKATVLKLTHHKREARGGGYRTVPLPENQAEPTPVDRHPYGCLAYCDHDNSLYLGPGANQTAPGGHPGDFWRLDLPQSTWHKLGPAPTGQLESVMCYSPPDKVIVLYAANRKTHLFDVVGQKWRAAKPKVEPPAGMGAAMTYDSKRRLVYLFAGPGSKGKEWNTPGAELWAYSVKKNEWTRLADSPVPARAPGFAYDGKHDVALAGIAAGAGKPNRIVLYHPGQDKWTELTRPDGTAWPTGASWQTLCYDASRDLFVYKAGNYDATKWFVFRYAPADKGK